MKRGRGGATPLASVQKCKGAKVERWKSGDQWTGGRVGWEGQIRVGEWTRGRVESGMTRGKRQEAVERCKCAKVERWAGVLSCVWWR